MSVFVNINLISDLIVQVKQMLVSLLWNVFPDIIR